MSSSSLDRRPHLALATWTVVVATIWLLRPPPSSWHFFHDAALLLRQGGGPTGGGGLSLWGSHPEFQFGPATVAFATGLHLLGGAHDELVARLVVAAFAPLLVWLLERATVATRPGADRSMVRRRALFAGFVLVPIWDYLAIGSVHIDDALAMTAAVVAVWAIAVHRPWVVAIALGIAANAKPWAVLFLPLGLATGPAQRRRVLGVASVLAFAPWLPFLIAAPDTYAALRTFRIHNASTSALRALGVHTRTTPPWDRPFQLGAGLLATSLAVRHGRWTGALVVGVAVRLLLDPGAHLYYSAGLVLSAVVWDLLASRWSIPWLSLLTAAALQLPRVLHAPPSASGWLRVAATVGSIIVVARCGAPATDDLPIPKQLVTSGGRP